MYVLVYVLVYSGVHRRTVVYVSVCAWSVLEAFLVSLV